MVVAPKSRWFVSSTMSRSCSASHTTMRRSRCGHVLSAWAPVRRMMASDRMWRWDRHLALVNDGVDGVVLHARDEVDAGVGPTSDLPVVVVGAVHGHDGPGIEAQEAQDLGVVHPGLADQHVGGQVIVVVQQDVGLDATFGAAERGPGKQTEAQTDGGRIEREQFVLETEPVCARAELALGTESARHRPEQVLEERSGPMHVGVGQVGRARSPGDAQMHQLPHAAGEAVADLTERVGMSQLTNSMAVNCAQQVNPLA